MAENEGEPLRTDKMAQLRDSVQAMRDTVARGAFDSMGKKARRRAVVGVLAETVEALNVTVELAAEMNRMRMAMGLYDAKVRELADRLEALGGEVTDDDRDPLQGTGLWEDDDGDDEATVH
jgi:hypothetical protein